jgi:hypothetical protein
MSTTAYFARARMDREFRDAELARLRWHQRTTVGAAVAITVGWSAYAAYVAWHEHRWADADPLFALAVAAGLYARDHARAAALAVMDSAGRGLPRRG